MLYFQVPASRCSPFVRKWRNWQTRKPQELVLAREWRFKSSLPHQPSLTRAVSELRLASQPAFADRPSFYWAFSLYAPEKLTDGSAFRAALGIPKNRTRAHSQLFGHHRNCDGHQTTPSATTATRRTRRGPRCQGSSGPKNTHRLAPSVLRVGRRRIGPPPIKPQDPVDRVNRSPSKRSCISAYAMTARTRARDATSCDKFSHRSLPRQPAFGGSSPRFATVPSSAQCSRS